MSDESLLSDTKVAALVRDVRGRFPAGQSGNPAGKAKGLKNFATRERVALEAALRAYMNDDAQLGQIIRAIDRLFRIAETGEDKHAIAAAKVLLDKVMTVPKDSEDTQQGPQSITVIIESAARAQVKPVSAVSGADDPIDAEFTEIEVSSKADQSSDAANAGFGTTGLSPNQGEPLTTTEGPKTAPTEQMPAKTQGTR